MILFLWLNWEGPSLRHTLMELTSFQSQQSEGSEINDAETATSPTGPQAASDKIYDI